MNHAEDGSSSRQDRLNRIISEYQKATRAGRRPDQQELLDQHKDLADELRSFFAEQDSMNQLAEPIQRQAGDPSTPDAGIDEPTLPPRAEASAGSASTDATLLPSPEETVDAPTLPSGEAIGVPGDPGRAVRANVRYFGDYELLEEIARGGMGVVYKARQMRLNRIVALKMILAGQLASEEDIKRFYTEAEAAANLDHPGIVPIFEVGEHERQHYFSMGFVEGRSLADEVAEGPLPPREAAELTKRVAEAVAYAHEHGVIHRDLKPANVLLKESQGSRAKSQEEETRKRSVSSSGSGLSTLDSGPSQPMVTDFGLAKRVEGESDLTATGQILGTPSYMPPEQAAGKVDQVGPTSDVYSIGAILYELLTGRPPFKAATSFDTLMLVLDTQPVPPRLLNPRVPRDLETICMKCLEKPSPARYPTAQALAEDIGRFLEGDPIQATSVNLLDRVTRALAHSQHDEHFRGWGLALISFGLVIFLAHVAMYALAVAGCGPLVAQWVPRAAMFAALLLLLWRFRPQSLLPTSSAERPIWAVWIGYLVALGATTLAVYLRGHSPTELYAYAAVLSGMAFFASGSLTWGGSYAIGIVFMAAAPLLACSPRFAVLWFGTLWGAALLAFGLHYRRLARGSQQSTRSAENARESSTAT
jgi:serine/threonine protein kinase